MTHATQQGKRRPVPDPIMCNHHNLNLTMDIMFVNKVPFLITLSYELQFSTIAVLHNRCRQTILSQLCQTPIFDDEPSKDHLPQPPECLLDGLLTAFCDSFHLGAAFRVLQRLSNPFLASADSAPMHRMHQAKVAALNL